MDVGHHTSLQSRSFMLNDMSHIMDLGFIILKRECSQTWQKKTHLAFGVPQTRFDLVFQANNNNNNNSFHSLHRSIPHFFLVNVGTPCADSFPSWWPFVHLPEPVVWHHHQNHDDHPRWRWSIPNHLGEHWQLGLKACWLKSQLGISLDLFKCKF